MIMSLKKLILISVFSVPLFLYAQERPSFQMKVVRQSDGTVYWPLSLPVYVQLTNDTVSKKSVILTDVRDSKTESVSVPMKWDGPGIHYLRHFDKQNHSLPNGEVAFPVHVDGMSPVSKLSLEGAPSFSSHKIYFGLKLKGRFSAKDDMSGVETTLISIDGEPFIALQSIIEFDQEKEYVVKYFAVDKVGNVEKENSKNFVVDKTAPTTAHSVGFDNIDGKVLSSRSVISLASHDKLSGVSKILVAFDDNLQTAYANSIRPSLLSDGDHTLTYFAIDNVNNVESKNQYTFYLDRTPPTVIAEIEGASAINQGKTFISKNSKIKFTAQDNKAGVKEIQYSINGRPRQSYISSFNVSTLQGSYTINFRAIDNVNNTGAFVSDNNLRNLFVDNTPPKIFHSIESPKVFSRDTLFVTGKSKVTLGSIDYQSGAAQIVFQVDKNPSSNYGQPFTLENEGMHVITYTGEDKVTNSSSKNFLVVVDNTAPKIFSHFGLNKIGTHEGKSVYPISTPLYLAATDDVVGLKSIRYSLNGGPWTDYSQVLLLTRRGKNVVELRAADKLGNETAPEVLEFFLK